jgi:hypothetical protein
MPTLIKPTCTSAAAVCYWLQLTSVRLQHTPLDWGMHRPHLMHMPRYACTKHSKPTKQPHQRACTSSIRHWDGAPLPQQLHECIINAQLHALDIHTMHQKLVAAVSKLGQRCFAQRQAAEALPPVGYDVVLTVTLPAAEI